MGMNNERTIMRLVTYYLRHALADECPAMAMAGLCFEAGVCFEVGNWLEVR